MNESLIFPKSGRLRDVPRPAQPTLHSQTRMIDRTHYAYWYFRRFPTRTIPLLRVRFHFVGELASGTSSTSSLRKKTSAFRHERRTISLSRSLFQCSSNNSTVSDLAEKLVTRPNTTLKVPTSNFARDLSSESDCFRLWSESWVFLKNWSIRSQLYN